MRELKWSLHPNHKLALDNPEYDSDGINDGWTVFWNSEEKRKQLDCGKCMSVLIKSLEDCINSKDNNLDVSVLKDCYKLVFTALPQRPINYLFRTVLNNYLKRYGNTTEYQGKIGGYGRGGTRVLFFYENSPKQVIERRKQLVEMVEDLDLIGIISESKGCEYMHNFINLDESLKTKVRKPEVFLKQLKKFKRLYDKGEVK